MLTGFVIITSLVILGLVIRGFKTIRHNERGVIETMGRFTNFIKPGVIFVVPIFQKLIVVSTTMKSCKYENNITTKDNINCSTKVQVHYLIEKDPEIIKEALYKFDNYKDEVIHITKNIINEVIGKYNFKEISGKKEEINSQAKINANKTKGHWGFKVETIEINQITPPDDVQLSINKLVKSQNEKESNLITAEGITKKAQAISDIEIHQAESKKKAKLIEAEGIKLYKLKVAQAEVEALTLIHENINKSFKENKAELTKIYDKAKENATSKVVK